MLNFDMVLTGYRMVAWGEYGCEMKWVCFRCNGGDETLWLWSAIGSLISLESGVVVDAISSPSAPAGWIK